MKILIMLLALMCCAFSCTSIPIKDAYPTNTVKSLELNACGNEGFGSVGCLVKKGESIQDKVLSIKIPLTNEKGIPSSLHIKSNMCDYDGVPMPVAGGSTVNVKLKNLIGIEKLNTSCVFSITVIPFWEDQDKFTYQVYPFTGTFYAVATEHEPYEFISVKQRNYDSAKNAPDGNMADKVIISTGSEFGQVLLESKECSFSKTVPFETKRLEIDLPKFGRNCSILGTIQRIDTGKDSSFFIEVQSIPLSHFFLQPPYIKDSVIYLDNQTGGIEVEGKLYVGNKFKFSSEWKDRTIVLYQYTTGGRSQKANIVNGVVEDIFQ